MNTLKKTAMMLAIGVGGLLTAAGASANLLDFTDDVAIKAMGCTGTQPCSLTTPANFSDATVTAVLTNGGTATPLKFYNPYGGPGSTGLAGATSETGGFDGAGITDDEQRLGNELIVEFSSLVNVEKIQALDLFAANGGVEQLDVTFYDSSNGVISSTALTGAGSGTGGYVAQVLSVSGVKKIVFTTPVGTNYNDDGNNDAALAGITYSVVPIPAAAWLFGSALVGMIGMGRRNSKNA